MAGRPFASVRWKTSSRLLAAQLGASSAGPAVSIFSPVPSGLMIPMRRVSPKRQVNAIEASVRAPFRRAIGGRGEGDPPLVRAVGVHHVELLRTRAVTLEDDLASVRRKAGVGVDAGRSRQTARHAAIRVDDVDVAVRSEHHREDDLRSIGRVARRKAHCIARKERPLVPRIEIDDADLRNAALEADVGKRAALRRQARRQHGRPPGVTIAVVVAVTVHDGDAFHPRVAGAVSAT